jgi:GntR family transcriptional repressor for pyruvate dehydrogenase complex
MDDEASVRSGATGSRRPRGSGSSTLHTVRRRSVVDEVVEQLTQRIVAGEWPPGYAMPGSRKLAADLGVSMLTVREAVRTLQGQNLVEVRHGSGTFVRDVGDQATVPWMLDPREQDEYLELIEARTLIEGELVRLAMERATDAERQRLLEVADEMDDARTDIRAFMEADLRFHTALAEAGHNRTLLRTMLAVRGPLRRFIQSNASWQIRDSGSLKVAAADHRAVAEAIARSDIRGGADAIGRILTRGRNHVLSSGGSSDQDTDEPTTTTPHEPRAAGGSG